MARFRRVPTEQRRRALASLARAVLVAALAVAAVVAERQLWPADTERIPTTIVLVVVGAIAAFAAVNLVVFVFFAVRWRRANRWDRMLDDPHVAHLVPPLREHSSAVRPRLPWVIFALAAVVGVVLGLAVLVYVALGRLGHVPYYESGDDDPTGVLLVVGVVVLLGGGAGLSATPGRRRAARVERLSAAVGMRRVADPDPTVDVPVTRGVRLGAVPRLDIEYVDADGRAPELPRSDDSGRDRPALLFLRPFDNIDGTREFLDGPWSKASRVHVLRSADQVGADEFDAALRSGDPSALFIEDRQELDAALAAYDASTADGSNAGSLPACALLCHARYWQSALDVLLGRVDVVVLDLTGFVPSHEGTRFEIQRVFDRFPIDRVTVLAGPTLDRRFLSAQLTAAWRNMADGSPNEGAGSRTLRVRA